MRIHQNQIMQAAATIKAQSPREHTLTFHSGVCVQDKHDDLENPLKSKYPLYILRALTNHPVRTVTAGGWKSSLFLQFNINKLSTLSISCSRGIIMHALCRLTAASASPGRSLHPPICLPLTHPYPRHVTAPLCNRHPIYHGAQRCSRGCG